MDSYKSFISSTRVRRLVPIHHSTHTPCWFCSLLLLLPRLIFFPISAIALHAPRSSTPQVPNIPLTIAITKSPLHTTSRSLGLQNLDVSLQAQAASRIPGRSFGEKPGQTVMVWNRHDGQRQIWHFSSLSWLGDPFASLPGSMISIVGFVGIEQMHERGADELHRQFSLNYPSPWHPSLEEPGRHTDVETLGSLGS